MSELSRTEIQARLVALDAGLDRFPAALMCPWPLARVFNECLKHAREAVPDDPVLRNVRSVRQSDPDADEASGMALVGTVQALTKQILVALDVAPAPDRKPKANPRVASRARDS